MNSLRYYLDQFNIKTPNTFKEFLEVNKDKNFEYCNTNSVNRKNKIIYKNLIFKKIRNFKEEIIKYYKEVLMFDDYFIRFKTEGTVTHNFVKVLKEAKEIFNLKYIAPNNDISNTRNMINNIIIDEESIYILCGYNKWKLESENKK